MGRDEDGHGGGEGGRAVGGVRGGGKLAGTTRRIGILGGGYKPKFFASSADEGRGAERSEALAATGVTSVTASTSGVTATGAGERSIPGEDAATAFAHSVWSASWSTADPLPLCPPPKPHSTFSESSAKSRMGPSGALLRASQTFRRLGGRPLLGVQTPLSVPQPSASAGVPSASCPAASASALPPHAPAPLYHSTTFQCYPNTAARTPLVKTSASPASSVASAVASAASTASTTSTTSFVASTSAASGAVAGPPPAPFGSLAAGGKRSFGQLGGLGGGNANGGGSAGGVGAKRRKPTVSSKKASVGEAAQVLTMRSFFGTAT